MSVRPNASIRSRWRCLETLSQILASIRRPILRGVVAPVQYRPAEGHPAPVIVDDPLETLEGVEILVGIGLEREFLAGIAAEMEDDRTNRVIALNVRGDARDKLTRTKVDALLHLVPT